MPTRQFVNTATALIAVRFKHSPNHEFSLMRSLRVMNIVAILFVSIGAAAQVDAGTADPQIAASLKLISAGQIQATIEKLASFQTRSTISAQDPASIASGHGIGAAREWIRAEFESYSRACGGCLQVKTDSFIEAAGDRIPQPTEITNVYAVLKGTDAESAKRIVLVTGHYDSRNSDTLDKTGASPGANDDGSGTAVSLECARVLSKQRFPATIIFLTVAGEEQGLNGSHHFAQMAKTEGWDLKAVLNNDIVGGDRNLQQDPGVVRVFSEGVPAAATDADLRRIRGLGGENDSTSRQLARYVAQVGRTYDAGVKPLLIFRLDRYLRGGDHYSFNQAGFAAIRMTEFREDYNHQHQNVRTENGVEFGDQLKFVDFDYVARVARLNAATMAVLASAPPPPDKVRIVTRELDNNTTLHWNDGHGAPSSTKYEVVWRETAAPLWQRFQLAGRDSRHDDGQYSVTLPVSKDNVIFGVRALDSAGHRSVAVVPMPER